MEARLVLCSLFMAACFDKGSECSGLHSGLHSGVPSLNRGWLCSSSDCWPYSALSPVKRVAERQGKSMKAKPFGLRPAAKVQSASFRLLLFALHSLLAALIKLEPRHISNVPAVATTPATTTRATTTTVITMRTFLLFCKLIKHWKKHSASSSLPLPLLICF